MNLDFLVFQLKLMNSVSPHVPLQDNLRAVIAPALLKLKRYCGAHAALHVFVNPELREVHVMAIGESTHTLQILERELQRRHEAESRTPVRELPQYHSFSLFEESETRTVFKPIKDINSGEYSQAVAGPLLKLIKAVAETFYDEFASKKPQSGDMVIVLPAASNSNPRLGYFVLWAPSQALAHSARDPVKREGRVEFRRAMEELLVQVFSNFYGMESHTYLPSYYKPEVKRATLVSAEICDFEGIGAILGRVLGPEQSRLMGSLVNRFASAAFSTVEKHRGRVDQIWGNGFLAVFGEYLDTPIYSPAPGCERALTASAEFVDEFEEQARIWLESDVGIEELRKNGFSQHIAIRPSVGIHYGEAIFDYVGSPERRVYMIVGDSVDLVRQLATIGSRGTSNRLSSITPGNICWIEDLASAPILLSESAHELSKNMLQPRKGEQSEGIHQPRLVMLPGHPGTYPVYPVWPDNVVRRAKRGVSKSA